MRLIHQDGIYWGADADVFNPDRFLKASNISNEALAGEQLHKSNHDLKKCAEEHTNSGGPQLNPAFLVFGAGSRSCIGSSFALKQLSGLVAIVLQRFEVNILLLSPHVPVIASRTPYPRMIQNIIRASQDD